MAKMTITAARCHHDSNRQFCRSFSLLVVKEPIWAIEQPINLARHNRSSSGFIQR
jgi:hypothetical protein